MVLNKKAGLHPTGTAVRHQPSLQKPEAGQAAWQTQIRNRINAAEIENNSEPLFLAKDRIV
eukprot:gene1306-756_t